MLNILIKKFDFIESSGVFHHMENPFLRWKSLVKSLKKGGLMRIGLYSQTTKRNISKIRDEIAELDIQSNNNDMKTFRDKIITSNKNHHKKQLSSLDIHNMSTFRDLLFHSQEHQFTITQIIEYLTQLGLKFCCFENKAALNKFHLFNLKENDLYNLKKCELYEEENPNTFSETYQFWCQKI